MSHKANLKPRGFRAVLVLAVLCSCVTAVSAQMQQQKPEDPEDEKKIGLWLDQGISAGLSQRTSLEIEFHERSTRTRRACSNTSFKPVLPSVRGRG